jgi:glycosyltransferase-like protein LARGE
MKKVCTNIPKWKYLSGIPKAQREADAAAEAAAKAEQEKLLQESSAYPEAEVSAIEAEE